MSSASDQPLDLELAVAPVVAAVPLAQGKAHLKVDPDDTDEEVLIQAYLNSCIGYVDGAEGVLARALVEQTWTLYLDAFPTRDCARAGAIHRRPWDEIALPLCPLIAVDAITYVDEAGVVQTLAPQAYQQLTGERSGIRPAFAMQWPATRRQARAVTITFRVGHARGTLDEDNNPVPPDPADVPPGIVSIILLMLGDLYLNREAQAITATRSALIENVTANRLLVQFKASWL